MHLEAFLLDLMASEDTEEAILAEQLLDWLLTEVVGAITLRVFFEITGDSLLVIHRVGPHQIAEDAVQRNLLLAIDFVNLFDLLESRTDATVHGQVLFGDVAADRHRVENLHEHIVNFDIEALQDFITECKGFSHVTGLVVSSKHHNIAWEVQFDREQENANFDALDATIYVVAQEEIVKTARFASLADHVQKICVLSMDITDHTNRFFNMNQVGFSCKEGEGLSKKTHNLLL